MPACLRPDYSGAFDPDVTLASFSRQALCHLGREYLLIGHLQDRVGLPLAMQLLGEDAQLQLSIDERMGASPIYSVRMQKALGFEGDDVGTVFKNLQLDIGAPPQFMDFQFRSDHAEYGEFWLPHCGALMDVEPFGEERVKRMCHDIEDPTFDAIAKVFQLHPHFHPRTYVDLHVEVTGASSARLRFGNCAALQEADAYSWLAGLGPETHPALDAIAGAVNPRARCHPVEHPTDAEFAWDVVIDATSEPQAEPAELKLARLSRGADFSFEQRRPLRD